MGFSNNWEIAYASQKQISIWPWDDLVSNFMRIYKSSPSKKIRVLELGCGSGANIPLFQNLDIDYYAIDGSKTAITNLKEIYPKYKDTIVLGDFSEPFPFDGKFDLIFDRASITHNNLNDVKKIMGNCISMLKNQGTFLGIHWFSDQGSYYKEGEPTRGEQNTRSNFKKGPFVGIEPVHFFSKFEIESLFEAFEIKKLEHISREIINNEDPQIHSMWNIVAQLKENL